MYGLQIWPIDALFNSRKWSKWAGKWQILSDSVRGGGGGGKGGGQLWSCQICSLKKIPLCMYVIDFSVRQLSNKKLSNKTTYIHTYRHHSDQISRSAWTARLKTRKTLVRCFSIIQTEWALVQFITNEIYVLQPIYWGCNLDITEKWAV